MAVKLSDGGMQKLPDEETEANPLLAKTAQNHLVAPPAIEALPFEGEILPLPEQSLPEWLQRCSKDEWAFTSATTVKNIKELLSSDRLTHYVRHSADMDDDTNYWEWIPRKLKQELRKKHGETDALGWGLIFHVQFSYTTFLIVWGIVTLGISLTLCLGLFLPRRAPLHGNVSAAIAVFFGPFGILGLVYTVVYNYARYRNFLK